MRSAGRLGADRAVVVAVVVGFLLGGAWALAEQDWVVGVAAVALVALGWTALCIRAFRRWERGALPDPPAPLRSDLVRVLVRSSGALAGLALGGACEVAPYKVQVVLAEPAILGIGVAAINAVYCLLCLALYRDRLVSAVALVICVLAGTAAVFLVPLVGH